MIISERLNVGLMIIFGTLIVFSKAKAADQQKKVNTIPNGPTQKIR